MNFTPRVRFSFLILSILFSGLANAQAKPLGEVVQNLRELRLDEKDFPFEEVPLVAQQLLSQMKQGLRQEITEVVADEQNDSATPEALRDMILQNLHANDVDIEPRDSDRQSDDLSGLYGRLLRLDVVRPEGHRDLLTFWTTISIPCGNDSSLYVFERKNSLWRFAIGREQNNYTLISDARGRFEFQISPPDESGNWFVVAVDVNPWCSSNWQGIRYEVLRPGFTPGRPRVLHSEERGIYLGVDYPFALSIRKDGFQIRQIASQSLDTSLLTREHIENYLVRDDHVERIPPYALNPEGFLDEWIELPWEDARTLAKTGNLSALKAWHGKLSQQRLNGFDTEFDFVQPCPHKGGISKWQIGLSLDALNRPNRPAHATKEIFFTISKRGERFFVVSVDATRPAGCPGLERPKGL